MQCPQRPARTYHTCTAVEKTWVVRQGSGQGLSENDKNSDHWQQRIMANSATFMPVPLQRGQPLPYVKALYVSQIQQEGLQLAF